MGLEYLTGGKFAFAKRDHSRLDSQNEERKTRAVSIGFKYF
jgi:hypothetical protein